MLSEFSCFCSRDRVKHSIGLIFWYNELSTMVSCRANSKGSISRSFNFLLDFGRIDEGGGAVGVFTSILTSPWPRC